MISEIETLIQKIKAYEQVLKSQERVISHYREQEKKWQEAVNTLESEREMNRKLTEEIAQIAKRIVDETISEMIQQLWNYGIDESNNPSFYKAIDATKKTFGVE